MNLILPIEIKKRELESKLLLALVAVEKGFDVLLGERSETNWVAADCVDLEGIIHHKDLAPVVGRTAFLKKVRANGFLNSVQDEESGLLERNYNDFFIKRFSSENIDLADFIFHWGIRDYEHFKTRFPHLWNRMHLTGSPRVDLWNKKFKIYYKEKRKKYILIVSNFGTVIGVDSPVEMMVRAGFEVKDNGIEYLKYMLRYQSFQSQTLERLIAFIFDLNSQFNDYDIIIRPHPIDDSAAWKAVFQGVEKIKIVNDGPLTPLVRNADVIIHNGCTTGIEAFVSHVPSYAFCPYGSWHDTEYADRFSSVINNIEDFVQCFAVEENYTNGPAPLCQDRCRVHFSL